MIFNSFYTIESSKKIYFKYIFNLLNINISFFFRVPCACRKETNINIGENANLSLFDPEHKYLFTKENVISKSKNSCFINSNLNGKAYGIISNNLVKVLGN